MKVSNLSLAIIMALGTVACGGSGGNEQTLPEDNPAQPAPQPETPPDAEANPDSTLVDPTQTHVVDNRDLLKESTVGSLQYIRREDSDYDRIFNPEQPASSTPLLGVSLDEQNPKLTNIVLARQELTRADGVPVKAQFTGGLSPEPLTREGKPQAENSLQVENFQNVDILAGAFKQFGRADMHTDGSTEIPNNALGDKFDYDTHVQNNVDKSGEFTRERVDHVYTLRYEYKQPYVDYPNTNIGDNVERHRALMDKKNDASFLPPGPPYIPSYAQMAENLKADPSYYTKERRDLTFHTPNFGLGSGPIPWQQLFHNSEPQYGNIDSPNGHNAHANNWRNKANEHPHIRQFDWTSLGPTRYHGSWPNGAYPQYMAHTPYYPNYVGGQSRYPNRPYREITSGTLGGKLNANTEYSHEHIYLDRDDFTAIRMYKSVRPLRNPVPNDWKWTLRQKWTYEESYQSGTDGSGNPIYSWRQIAKPVDAYIAANDCGTANCAATATGQTRNWRLTADTKWIDPQNQENGIQGEFRGPHYDGWREDIDDPDHAQAGYPIRYSDERIWKPGTPGYKPENERKFGANLIWWSTQDSAFENWATSQGWDPRARRVDNNTSKKGTTENLVWGAGDNKGGDAVRDKDIEIQPTGDITNGLIRVGDSDPYRTSANPGRATLGEELKWDDKAKVWRDHHNTKTRIFGHYHLAYADADKNQIAPVSFNSYKGVRSFVAQVKGKLAQPSEQQRNGYVHQLWADLDTEPTEYSIGAVPNTLKYVQYGRVTTKLDIDDGEGPFHDGFLRAPLTYKNDPAGVDNYFFRGVQATSIEQMNALPSNSVLTYSGHALMYGIDNNFHGITGEIKEKSNTGLPLPNAFAIEQAAGGGVAKMGLGNFVDVTVDLGSKKVRGDVYNAWLEDLKKPTVLKDKLVHFTGDVIGNTVIGTADRTYATGDDKADFRAAFFGPNADEMGGSFNSVTREKKYGSAYQDGDWGGVFGASKNASNTFQGDDGANVYNGL